MAPRRPPWHAPLLLLLFTVCLPSHVHASPPPIVWGGGARPGFAAWWCTGALFAFSGLDGPTVEDAGAAGSLVGVQSGAGGGDDYGIEFCGLSDSYESLALLRGPRRLLLRPKRSPGARAEAVTNDAILVSFGEGRGTPLLAVFESWRVVLGTMPEGGTVALAGGAERPRAAKAPGCVVAPSRKRDALALCVGTLEGPQGGLAWALAFDASGDGAEDVAVSLAQAALGRARAGAGSTALQARLRQYPLNPVVSPDYQPTLHKAVSVMRVNALAPEGELKTLWSTPDREPHRWLWLWDSCYHAMGMAGLPAVALGNGSQVPGDSVGWQYLDALISGADAKTGKIPITRKPNEAAGHEGIHETQPPILAWAAWDNFEAAVRRGAREEGARRLAGALPALEAYLRWDVENRRANLTEGALPGPLFAWHNGAESGMDNSIRFDATGGVRGDASGLAAVDFTYFMAQECAYVARIRAEVVGADDAGVLMWRGFSANISAALHEALWDEGTGLYLDRFVVDGKLGTFSPVKAVTTLLPLGLKDTPSDRAAALLSAATDAESGFGTRAALSSISRDDPKFSTDMWRGPMWINYNYMVALGMLGRGATREAVVVVDAAVSTVRKYYERHGVVFEFYDADDTHDPRKLLRKRKPFGGIRDYHWTAALTLRMLLLRKDMHCEEQRGPC